MHHIDGAPVWPIYPGIEVPPFPKGFIKECNQRLIKEQLKEQLKGHVKDTLDEDRKAIQEIDKQMIELFNARNKLAIKIGQTKKAKGFPVYNGAVESKKLQQTPPEAQPLLVFLMNYSKKLQEML
ncbi:hypothetical protein KNT81_gp176 [Proteus phage phiP4-3]|uniref:Chorismate mutase domain-containing protein n=1 Tax=Proteus phage phiP4-3 TaxID=2065203 RepID=A0A2I6PFS9_9CAUD|nr:hypothetical protein KNT81_gp176 [Proteus phage phiP4-3]AUM58595.1 hypothetical protein phiP43_237 [Proteus phage phiP4-3]